MLGFTVHGGALSPLRVDPLDDALRRVQKLRVEPSGTVAYERLAVDPRTGARETERVVVGQLALARFAAGTKLHAIDANHFEPPKDVLPHVGRPGDGNFGVVATFAREASRVDIDESLRKLKDAYLAFDALAAAHKAQGRAGKTAMDLLK
jgi:flagellar basal body rod protein FlgG